MSTYRISILYKLLILFYLCWGSHAWFTFGLDTLSKFENVLLNFICFLIALIYKSKTKVPIKNNFYIVFAITCFCTSFFMNSIFGPLLPVNLFLKYYPLYVLIHDEKHNKEILSFVTKFLAIILVPGIVLQIINLVVGLPPSIIIIHPSNEAYTFFNYFFMLTGASWYEYGGDRFQSIFAEPGYLGLLLSFLLYVEQYDFKKKTNIILLISLCFSFSLQGISTFLIGITMYNLSQNKKIRSLISVVILCIPIYYIGIEYNNGKNFINEKIIMRLALDEEKGIAGNNRVGEDWDIYFEKCIENGTIINGIGISKAKWDLTDSEGIMHGAGIKKFLIINGLISAILVSLFYFLLGLSRKTRKNYKYLFGLFVIYLLFFIVQAYPFNLAWIACYILGFNNAPSKKIYYAEKKLSY